jgi:outer membrane protein OmpA-like peptidoglycan-associated protein
MRALLLMLAGCAAVMCGPAGADPAYKAQDIIKHFAPATRSLCIGTEAQCGTVETNPNAKAGFDLLITFDLNSAQLTDKAKENLGEFAKALADPQLSGSRFEVDGHTDARGEDQYKQVLSERRAEAVVDYLASLGVDQAKLVPKGFGKTQPRSPDPYDPINRRVETKPITE